MKQSPTEITQLLSEFADGDSKAGNQLLELVYTELHRIALGKMARLEAGHTLQPTALVNEAWLHLVDAEGRARFANRAHFFGAAAEAMRRILVDHARAKHAAKRGGDMQRCELGEIEIAAPGITGDEVLAVHEVLDQLAALDARKAELVKLRYFLGFSFEETAEILGISVSTANRDWAYARAWLHAALTHDDAPANPGAA